MAPRPTKDASRVDPITIHLGNSRLPAGLTQLPYPGADQTRVKQQIVLAYREQRLCQVNSEFRIIEQYCPVRS